VWAPPVRGFYPQRALATGKAIAAASRSITHQLFSTCSLLCMPWAILFAPVQPRRPLAPLSQHARHRCHHCDAREEHLDDKPTQCVTTALHVPPRRRAIPSCVRRSPTLLPLGARSLSRGCLCAISHPPPARTPAYGQTTQPHVQVMLPLFLPAPASAAMRCACTCHSSLTCHAVHSHPHAGPFCPHAAWV
jgi:hypothetical protein